MVTDFAWFFFLFWKLGENYRELGEWLERVMGFIGWEFLSEMEGHGPKGVELMGLHFRQWHLNLDPIMVHYYGIKDRSNLPTPLHVCQVPTAKKVPFEGPSKDEKCSCEFFYSHLSYICTIHFQLKFRVNGADQRCAQKGTNSNTHSKPHSYSESRGPPLLQVQSLFFLPHFGTFCCFIFV